MSIQKRAFLVSRDLKSGLVDHGFEAMMITAGKSGLVHSLRRNHSKLEHGNSETRIVYGSLLVCGGRSKFESRVLGSIRFRVNIDKVFWKAWARDGDCLWEEKRFSR